MTLVYTEDFIDSIYGICFQGVLESRILFPQQRETFSFDVAIKLILNKFLTKSPKEYLDIVQDAA